MVATLAVEEFDLILAPSEARAAIQPHETMIHQVAIVLNDIEHGSELGVDEDASALGFESREQPI